MTFTCWWWKIFGDWPDPTPIWWWCIVIVIDSSTFIPDLLIQYWCCWPPRFIQYGVILPVDWYIVDSIDDLVVEVPDVVLSVTVDYWWGRALLLVCSVLLFGGDYDCWFLLFDLVIVLVIEGDSRYCCWYITIPGGDTIWLLWREIRRYVTFIVDVLCQCYYCVLYCILLGHSYTVLTCVPTFLFIVTDYYSWTFPWPPPRAAPRAWYSRALLWPGNLRFDCGGALHLPCCSLFWAFDNSGDPGGGVVVDVTDSTMTLICSVICYICYWRWFDPYLHYRYVKLTFTVFPHPHHLPR